MLTLSATICLMNFAFQCNYFVNGWVYNNMLSACNANFFILTCKLDYHLVITLTFVELLACSQGFLQWSVVVGGMKVEDVHTGGLQAGQGGCCLLQHTLPLKTLRAPGVCFGLYQYLRVITIQLQLDRGKNSENE